MSRAERRAKPGPSSSPAGLAFDGPDVTVESITETMSSFLPGKMRLRPRGFLKDGFCTFAVGMTTDAVGAEENAVKLRHFACVPLLARWGDLPREVVRLEVVKPRGEFGVCTQRVGG